jgi:hypothetical protein
MESGSVSGMNASFEMLSHVKELRAQLKDRADKKPSSASVNEKITALDKTLAEMEGASQSAFFGLPPRAKQPENLSTLNQHFGATLAIADSADATPTTQATAVFKELQDALRTLEDRWKNIRDSDVAALNAELQKAGLAPVDPNKKPEAALSDDADGDDEP